MLDNKLGALRSPIASEWIRQPHSSSSNFNFSPTYRFHQQAIPHLFSGGYSGQTNITALLQNLSQQVNINTGGFFNGSVNGAVAAPIYIPYPVPTPMPIAIPVSQIPMFIPVPTPVPTPMPAPVFVAPEPAPAPRPTAPLPGRLTDTADVDKTYHDPDVGRFGGIVDKGDYLHMGPNSPVPSNRRHIPAGHVTDWNPEGKAVVISPIALDLDGNGRISTTGNSTAKNRMDNHIGSTVQFDLDADGKTDQVEWLSGGKDGFLVDTREIGVDGAIDGKALFGDMGGKFGDGFEKLALLDANHDGQLTDSELQPLGVWVDNGNGRLEAGELKSLSELNLNQISTQRKDELNERGETLMRSSANKGGMMIEDVWLASK